MKKENIYDVLVIGGGPGGYVCAIRASQLGMKVGLIDRNSRLGGTCLNVGCIPSKALLHSTEIYHQLKTEAKSHGIECERVSHNLETMMKRKEGVVNQLGKGVKALVSKKGVQVFNGTARLKGKGTVSVVGKDGKLELAAKEIILATGSEPVELKDIPFDGNIIINSDHAIAFKEVPEKLAVIGGGAIGLEMACVWSRLGSEVTVIEFLDEICPHLDPEVSKATRRIFESQGISFRTSTKVESAKLSKKNATLLLAKKGTTEEIKADRVLVAVGRKPYSHNLGLEELGIKSDDRGRVLVDASFSTNVEGVRAIGDLIPGPMLAHKAEEDGVACAEIIANQAGHVDYNMIPGVIYTEPEIATIGLSQKYAEEQGIKTRCGSFPMAGNGRALATSSTQGMVKIVADAATDQILGVQIVAHGASELIASAVAHMEYGGSAEDLARTVHAHPTLSESLKEAALSVDGRGLHSL